MSTLTKNPFANVLDEVQSAPPSQKTAKLVQGIGKAMQQLGQSSGNQQIQEWSSEYQQITPQLIQSCNQQQV